MAVTITGGKYAIRSLTAVGTTSVTIGTGTFVSGDFGATQRMVSLFTSGNVFKGIAWVRRFTSTTVLELENRFVDPVTGLYATQVVGDQVLVSKNSAESAVAGWAVTSPDTNVVTVSDNVLMGTAGSEVSLCFYDENKQFTMTNGFRFNGGVAVFGKLMSYDGVSKESFIWSRECTARPNENYPLSGSPAYNLWGTGGTSSHMFFFGGAVGSPMRRSFFIGAEGTLATNKSFAFYGTRLYHACASPNNGGNWASNADRHLLYKTIHEADYNNADLIVWGNGAFQGSFLSFPQYGAGTPLGIFRASGSVSFGASTNNRTIVADLGTGAFIDDINNGTYTFTNTITPSVNIVRHPGGATPVTMQFSDDYTNLKNRTTLVVQRGDGTIATSTVNTANTTFTATVVQATYSGTANGNATNTAFYTTFNYTVKCYGYGVVNGTHNTYTYSLGTAGDGTDLKLGGLINQLEDTGVTLTETNALALSSKISINSTTKVITITANVTYDELYDYTVAWNCSSAANAVLPALNRYLLTYSGANLSAPTGWSLVVNTGVTLSYGTKFTYIYVPTITLNGTGAITGVYANTTGTSTTWQFQDVTAGTSLVIYDNAGNTKYFNAVSANGTYNYYIPPQSSAVTYYYAIEKYGTKRETGSFPSNAGGVLFYVPAYAEDVGITQTNQATVAAYTAIDTLDKFYDAVAVYRLSETGIKLGQLAERNGSAVDIGTHSLVVNQSASVVLTATSSLITIKALSFANGSKFTLITATPPKTVTANTNEVITASIEDANGDSSVTIQGGSGDFTLWKISNATDEDDYATGTNLGNVGNVIYRFLNAQGFKIVIRDNITSFRQVVPMDKGIYTRGLFFGDQVQLAQSAEVTQINTKVDILQLDIERVIKKENIIIGLTA